MKLKAYLSNEVLTLRGHRNLMALRIRKVNGFGLDQLVHLLVIVVTGVEGRESNNHLVG